MCDLGINLLTAGPLTRVISNNRYWYQNEMYHKRRLSRFETLECLFQVLGCYSNQELKMYFIDLPSSAHDLRTSSLFTLALVLVRSITLAVCSHPRTGVFH